MSRLFEEQIEAQIEKLTNEAGELLVKSTSQAPGDLEEAQEKAQKARDYRQFLDLFIQMRKDQSDRDAYEFIQLTNDNA